MTYIHLSIEKQKQALQEVLLNVFPATFNWDHFSLNFQQILEFVCDIFKENDLQKARCLDSLVRKFGIPADPNLHFELLKERIDYYGSYHELESLYKLSSFDIDGRKALLHIVLRKIEEYYVKTKEFDLVLMSELKLQEKLEKGKLYIKLEGGIIKYKVLDGSNTEQSGEIKTIDMPSGVAFPTSNDLGQFSQIKKGILKVTSKRDHIPTNGTIYHIDLDLFNLTFNDVFEVACNYKKILSSIITSYSYLQTFLDKASDSHKKLFLHIYLQQIEEYYAETGYGRQIDFNLFDLPCDGFWEIVCQYKKVPIAFIIPFDDVKKYFSTASSSIKIDYISRILLEGHHDNEFILSVTSEIERGEIFKKFVQLDLDKFFRVKDWFFADLKISNPFNRQEKFYLLKKLLNHHSEDVNLDLFWNKFIKLDLSEESGILGNLSKELKSITQESEYDQNAIRFATLFKQKILDFDASQIWDNKNKELFSKELKFLSEHRNVDEQTSFIFIRIADWLIYTVVLYNYLSEHNPALHDIVKVYDLILTSTLRPQQQLEQGKLYIKHENNGIDYKVLNNENEKMLGKITANDIDDGVILPANDNLEQFLQIKEEILKVTSNRGHTQNNDVIRNTFKEIRSFSSPSMRFKLTQLFLENICSQKEAYDLYIHFVDDDLSTDSGEVIKNKNQVSLLPALILVSNFFRLFSSVVQEQKFIQAPSGISSFIPQGLKLVDISGEGNCLYNAVAIYLNQDVQTLRQVVTAHLEYNIDEYKEFIILPSSSTIENYIQDIRNTNEWAGDLEITVLSKLLVRPIIIIGSNGKIINKQVLSQQQNEEPIFVYYNNVNHYDGLVLQEGYNAREILNTLLQEEKKNAMKEDVRQGRGLIKETLTKIIKNKRRYKDGKHMRPLIAGLHAIFSQEKISTIEEKFELANKILEKKFDLHKDIWLSIGAIFMPAIINHPSFADFYETIMKEVADFNLIFQQICCDVFQVTSQERISNYNKTFRQKHNLTALLTYYAKMQSLIEPERTQMLEVLNKYFNSVLADGDESYIKLRYCTDSNPQLKVIFEHYPDLKPKWEQGYLTDYRQFIEDHKLTNVVGKQFDLKSFVVNMIMQNHLPNEYCEEFKEYIKPKQERKLEIIKELNKEKDTLKQTGNLEKNLQNRLNACELQLELIDAVSNNYGSREEQVNKLQKTIKFIDKAKLYCEFRENLTQAIRALTRNRSKETTNYDVWKIVDTDNYWSMFMAGTDIEGSCQRVDGDPKLNKCLMGYVMNGDYRMLAIENTQGITVARCIIHLLWDEDRKLASLFMEEAYPFYINYIQEQALIQLAINRAKHLGLNLVSITGEDADSLDYYGNTLLRIKGGVAPWIYSDATHNKVAVKDQNIEIKNAKFLYNRDKSLYLDKRKELDAEALRYGVNVYQQNEVFFSGSKFATPKQPYGPYSDRLCCPKDPITELAVKCSKLSLTI